MSLTHKDWKEWFIRGKEKKKVSEMKQNLLNHVFFFFNLNAVCGETCSPGVAIPVVLQSRAFC